MEKVLNVNAVIEEQSKPQSNAVLVEVDQALDSTSHEELEADSQKQRGSALARALRIVSTIIIVGAGGVFLFQGWAGMDSLMRVLSFTGFSAILGLVGLLCAFKFKEEKGARTALILGAVLIPVITSQIGALVYSLGHVVTTGPAIFILKAASASQVTTAVIAAALVLIPLAFTAFSVMARSKAKQLTVVYALSNAALLLPFREPDIVGAMSLALLGAIIAADMKFFKNDSKLNSFEGKLSRILPFIPFVIMIGRNLMMYAPSAMLFSAIFAGVGSALFFALPRYSEDDALAMSSQALGSLFMCASWSYFVYAGFETIYREVGELISNDFFIPTVGIPMSFLLVGLSLFSRGNGKGYRVTAGAVAVATTLFQMAIIGGIVSSTLCIVVAIALLIVGYAIQEGLIASLGIMGLIVGLAAHVRYAMVIYTMSPWVTLAVIGTLVLIGSSYLERNYEVLIKQIRELRSMVRIGK